MRRVSGVVLCALLAAACVDLTQPDPSCSGDACGDAGPDAPDAIGDTASDLLPPDSPVDRVTPPDTRPADSGPADSQRAGKGEACGSPGACASGFCVDGVCCESACSNACETCNLEGKAGTCAPIAAGEDPGNDCMATEAAMCGQDGTCDGNRACRLHPAGTQCAPGACADATESAARTCDGKGVCRPAVTKPCAPYRCQGGTCASSCASNGDCTGGGTICEAGKCSGLLPSGATCTAATQCLSGFCTDGVCCGVACNGVCQACNVPGSLGACVPVAAGEDPANECPTEDPATCGREGTCDGNGACRLHAAATACSAAACEGSTLTPARTCDGMGACQPAAPVACRGYVCASATECALTCTSDAGCVAPNICIGGSCQSPKSMGAACGGNNECASGFCAQGVCCQTACTGTCQSCALTGTVGTCTPVAAGQDPLDQCAASPASSCGTDGTCDGAGACRLHVAGAECVAPSCSGTTVTPRRTCDGKGTCLTVTAYACDPYICESGSCKKKCNRASDCVSGSTCVNNVCTSVKKANGDACGAGTECLSGICAHGVCCNTACGGTCQACNLVGNEGTCTSVPAGQDPLSQCADAGTASCGTTGSCNGAGACAVYAVGTSCAAATCSSATYTPARTCDGNGTCRTATGTSCGQYQCNGTACRTSCASTADCAGSSVCNGGACGGLKGEYFDGMNFESLKFTRTDARVDFDWSTGVFDTRLGDGETISIRWTGKVTPRHSELYTFYTQSDDGVRLWVNGLQLVNNWTNHGSTENSQTIQLTAGQSYDITMEYYENTNHAIAKLSWSSPSQPKEIIPTSQLVPAP